jgi:hypothetical protein
MPVTSSGRSGDTAPHRVGDQVCHVVYGRRLARQMSNDRHCELGWSSRWALGMKARPRAGAQGRFALNRLGAARPPFRAACRVASSDDVVWGRAPLTRRFRSSQPRSARKRCWIGPGRPDYRRLLQPSSGARRTSPSRVRRAGGGRTVLSAAGLDLDIHHRARLARWRMSWILPESRGMIGRRDGPPPAERHLAGDPSE